MSVGWWVMLSALVVCAVGCSGSEQPETVADGSIGKTGDALVGDSGAKVHPDGKAETHADTAGCCPLDELPTTCDACVQVGGSRPCQLPVCGRSPAVWGTATDDAGCPYYIPNTDGCGP
jgi:hypothetical protein